MSEGIPTDPDEIDVMIRLYERDHGHLPTVSEVVSIREFISLGVGGAVTEREYTRGDMRRAWDEGYATRRRQERALMLEWRTENPYDAK